MITMRLFQIKMLLFVVTISGYSQTNSTGEVVIITTSKFLFTTDDVVDFAVMTTNPDLNYVNVDFVDKLGLVNSTRTIKLMGGQGEGSLPLEGVGTGYYRLFASAVGIIKEPFQVIKVFDQDVVNSSPKLVQRVLFLRHRVEIELSGLFDLNGLSLNIVDSLIPINNFLSNGTKLTIPRSIFEGRASFQIMRGDLEIDKIIVPNNADFLSMEVDYSLIAGQEYSINFSAKSGASLKSYVVSVAAELALNNVTTLEIGEVAQNYKGDKTRKINPAITNAASLVGEPSLLYSYFQPYHLVKETRIDEMDDISLSIPDVYEDNYVWSYAFDKMGNRLGEIEIQQFVRSKEYEPFAKPFRVTTAELEFVKKKQMQTVVNKAFAINIPPMPSVNYDDNIADNTVLTSNYILPPSMAEFIVSVVPKATIKKRKGQRLILMSANGTQEKFPNSPLFMIDDKFTFDCEQVLALDVNKIVKIDLFNSRSALRDFGLLGRNGVMRIFTSQSDNGESTGFKIEGLHKRNTSHLMSSPEVPDLRDLLVFQSGANLGDSPQSITFKAPKAVGSYIITIIGINEHGVVSKISEKVLIEGK